MNRASGIHAYIEKIIGNGRERQSVHKNDEYLRPIVDRQKRSECECIHKGDDKNTSL